MSDSPDNSSDSKPPPASSSRRIAAAAQQAATAPGRLLNRAATDGSTNSAWRWFMLSGLVGLAAGTGAIIFYYMSAALAKLLLVGFAGYEGGGPAREPEVLGWIEPLFGFSLVAVVLLPGIGNALAVWLKTKYAPDTVPFGTDATIDSYHKRRQPVKLWRVGVNMVASTLTLATGNSGGREGPIAQVGSALSAWIGDKLGLTARDRRILLAAGMAAGIGAVFRAPLAAALFAAEILYRDSEVESEVLMPSIISSVTAYCLFSLVTGDFSPLFTLGPTPFIFENPLELISYTTLAIAAAGAGLMFVWTRHFVGHIMERFRHIAAWIRAGIGGLLTGLTALLVLGIVSIVFSTNMQDDVQGVEHGALAVLSVGYGLIQGLIDPAYAESHDFIALDTGDADILLPLLLLIAVGKMLSTSFTTGSGGAAGKFGPAMVIGGCVGGAVGCAFHLMQGELPASIPALAPSLDAFVIVGLACFFAGVAKTPISSVIMVAELTASYGLIIPAIWTCSLTFLLLGSKRGVLFGTQPTNRSESAAHRGDFLLDVFSNMRVGDILTKRLEVGMRIPESWPLSKIVPQIIRSRETYFPVVDKEERLVGIFSINDIREVLYDDSDQSLAELVSARDIATTRITALRADDELNDALARFTARGWEYLPVVEASDETQVLQAAPTDGDGDTVLSTSEPKKKNPRLLGMLSRRALLAEYTERLHDLKVSGESTRMRRVQDTQRRR